MKTQFQTGMEIINMIIYQKTKPFVPKYANYDYVMVYDGNDNFIGWIRIYYELARR